MPWPSWAFWRQNEETKKEDKPSQSEKNDSILPPLTSSSEPPTLPTSKTTPWNKNLNRTDWSHYTTTQTITISLITTATTLALIRAYKTYLRRIPTVDYLKPGFFRHRNLYGFVTRVGDGDNFHLFHTPGGRWLGWGWLPGRKVKNWTGKELKGRTLHVRIAGVDAPELAHFGRPAQPFGQEAIDWLTGHIHHRYVRVYPFRQDQYNRVVCAVYKRRFLFWKSDVGLQMIKRGLATVYEAKWGSEFGDKEEKYRQAQEAAKERKAGMWAKPGIIGRMLGRESSKETPREYKTRMSKEDKKSNSEK